MKLRALELEQFRKFDRPSGIAGMADGLNLVVGPNEMGKSTLFAALHAVLFERHRSQAQNVKSLQPAGHEGAAPRVALSFTIGDRRYRIEKRFLRRPSALLLLPDGRQLHGEAAEEALDRLLAGGDAEACEAGRRGALDAPGIWSLLWVGQGQSFVQPEIAAGARGTLPHLVVDDPRHQDDRRRREARVVLHEVADLVAIPVRHDDVADDHVGHVALEAFERLAAGRRTDDLDLPARECPLHDLADADAVVDHQDPGHVLTSPRRSPRRRRRAGRRCGG